MQTRSFRLSGSALALTLALTLPALAQPNAREGDPDVARFDGDSVVRARIRTAEDLTAISAISPDPWTCGTPGLGLFDFRIPAGRLPDLQATGIPFDILIPDVQALIDAENVRLSAVRLEGGGGGGAPGPGGPWFNDYKNYADISAYASQLAAEFPALATRFSLGQSFQGREVFGLRIAAPGTPANAPAIFLHGLQHAREWITGATTMYLADRLLRTATSDPAVAATLASLQFIIVPVSNPDGYVYTWTNNRLWRKNRRPNPNGSVGTDTNRNWGFAWGLNNGSSGTQGSETYRGPSAFSEVETQLLRDFALARPFIRAHFDVHSYSQLVLSPNGYTADLPPSAPLFDDLNALLVRAFARAHGTTFVGGPTFSTIYPVSGGSTDWFFGDRGFLSWGVELRDTGQTGFLLPAAQIIPTGEETFDAVMDLAWAIAFPIRFSVPSAPVDLIPAGDSTPIPMTIWPMPGHALDPASPRLHIRVGRTAPFDEIPLTPGAGLNAFSATLPALPCSAEVAIYFSARTAAGQQVYWPPAVAGVAVSGAPAHPLVLTAAALEPGGSTLVPCPPCPGDFNRDGDPNPDDLSDFIAAYFTVPAGSGTDVNADGVTDPDDLSDFIAAYFSAC